MWGTVVTDQMINEPMTKIDCCDAWHSALHACYWHEHLSLSSELSSLCHLALAGTRSCVTGMTACATRRSWDNTMTTSLLLRRLRTRGILRFLFQLFTWVIESVSWKCHIKTEHLTLSITILFPLYPKNIALPLESCIWCMLMFLFPRFFLNHALPNSCHL